MKKRRRGRVSLGTICMLLLTGIVLASCVCFLSVIAGHDVYERTGEYIRMLSEEGIFQQMGPLQVMPSPTRKITFIEDTPPPASLATPTPIPEKRTITMAVGGTVYAPKAVRQGAKSGARFDFTSAFDGLSGVLREADLAMATLETLTAGESLGYGNYNTPPEILDALRSSGVDLVALATEHALDLGYQGMDITISELTSRGLAYAGVNPDGRSGSRATMMSIGGIQVAVLNYTYGLSEAGNQKTKQDSRGVVARIDTDAMIQDVKQARVDGANLVIVLPHWGTKNKQDTADTLQILAYELAKAGADVILGSHSNVVQGTQRLRVTRSDGLEYDAIVCYSLGSLLTDSRTAENTAGMIAQIDVTYDPVTRRTTLGELNCIPVYVASQREDGKTVYRAVNAGDETALEQLEKSEREKAAQAEEMVIRASQMPDSDSGEEERKGKLETVSGGRG